MARHQFQLALLPGRPAVSLGQHEEIVAAIVARDPVAAELAMREHIASVVDALRSLPDRQAQLAAAGRPSGSSGHAGERSRPGTALAASPAEGSV
jgi:hypothetical protein